jgi:hypothetical protein
MTGTWGAQDDSYLNSSGFLVKTDSLGNVLQASEFGGSGAEVFRLFAQEPDGGFTMCGFSNSTGAGDYDGYLVKTDSAGTLGIPMQPVVNNPSIVSGNLSITVTSHSVVPELRPFTRDNTWVTTGVPTLIHQKPSSFSLNQNFPNPFNPNTTITFTIEKKENVSITIYDILGRRITTLLEKQLSPGKYSIPFHAQHLASGVYMYQLRAGDFLASKRMILMK